MTAGWHRVAGTAPQVASPWFVRPRPNPDAALRLFCFAHAGGAASAYFQWAARLPDVDVVAIQLPGREGRLAEPLIDDAVLMVTRLTAAIGPLLDRPFVFFGHSMGSYLAFETARALRRAAMPMPSRLILSGRRAPTMAEGEPPLHQLPDDAFVNELNRRFGGLPAVILAEPELMAMYLPIIRSDIRLLECARYQDEAPLAVPFTVCGGVDDRRADEAALSGWAALTVAGCDLRMFPGGHFYLHDQRDSFLPVLAAILAADLAAITRRAGDGA